MPAVAQSDFQAQIAKLLKSVQWEPMANPVHITLFLLVMLDISIAHVTSAVLVITLQLQMV